VRSVPSIGAKIEDGCRSTLLFPLVPSRATMHSDNISQVLSPRRKGQGPDRDLPPPPQAGEGTKTVPAVIAPHRRHPGGVFVTAPTTRITSRDASPTELKFHRDNLIYGLIRAASGHTTILDAKAGGCF
jgi:hypothetical protein